MPIWPMPKQYTRGDEELVVDAYSFRFLPNKNHPDILAAAKRYTEMMFRDNIPAPVYGNSLVEVKINVADYDVPLNVRLFPQPSP